MDNEKCRECGFEIDSDEPSVFADVCNDCCRNLYPDDYDEFMSR